MGCILLLDGGTQVPGAGDQRRRHPLYKGVDRSGPEQKPPHIKEMRLSPFLRPLFPFSSQGGTHERGDSRLEVDPQTVERVLRENGALFNGMA